jgi:hypothetical protein
MFSLMMQVIYNHIWIYIFIKINAIPCDFHLGSGLFIYIY